jgi:hypothetical protein
MFISFLSVLLIFIPLIYINLLVVFAFNSTFYNYYFHYLIYLFGISDYLCLCIVFYFYSITLLILNLLFFILLVLYIIFYDIFR